MPLPEPSSDGTCLVTGASSGIGNEMARILARRGLGLTLVARREDRLRDLASELHGASGVRVEVVAADLTDVDERRRVERHVVDAGLRVDVLVNNAGFSTSGPVRSADRDREIAMIRTDVEAVVDLCATFVGPMTDRGRGSVLNVASTAAFQPLPGQAGYAASKSFVLSYTQALRAELRGTGVTVTALCPGPVRTEFMQTAGWQEGEVDDVLPRAMWLSPVDVAAAAVDGLDRGRGVVIPGRANLLSAYGAYLTPRRLLLPLVARFHPSLAAN